VRLFTAAAVVVGSATSTSFRSAKLSSGELGALVSRPIGNSGWINFRVLSKWILNGVFEVIDRATESVECRERGDLGVGFVGVGFVEGL